MKTSNEEKSPMWLVIKLHVHMIVNTQVATELDINQLGPEGHMQDTNTACACAYAVSACSLVKRVQALNMDTIVQAFAIFHGIHAKACQPSRSASACLHYSAPQLSNLHGCEVAGWWHSSERIQQRFAPGCSDLPAGRRLEIAVKLLGHPIV